MTRPTPVVALYPGSFDPITRGHEDIARRALRVADHVIVGVAHTSTHAKQGLFEVEERVDLIRSVFAAEPRIEVQSFTGLLVDFARDQGACLVVRGLRAVSDFEYELQIAQANADLAGELETIFLPTRVNYAFVSASLVREIARHGGDVSRYAPEPVCRALSKKYS